MPPCLSFYTLLLLSQKFRRIKKLSINNECPAHLLGEEGLQLLWEEEGLQLLEDEPQLLEDGLQLLEDGPQLLEDEPQLLEDGPQLPEDKPQLHEDGPQSEDGPQLQEAVFLCYRPFPYDPVRSKTYDVQYCTIR
jgi:hypothetical protein